MNTPSAGPERAEALVASMSEREEIERFSFIKGGPIYTVLRAIGLASAGLRGATILSLVLIAFCLLPLIALTAIDGTLLGPRGSMPLLADFATLGRFLIALPALVLIAPDSDMLSRRALSHFLDSGLVRSTSRGAFFAILADALRLRNSVWPEIVLAFIAFVPALMMLGDTPLLRPIEGWRLDGDGSLSRASIWFDFVAKPVWLLIALLWIWRLVLWTIMVERICQLGLALRAAHPDGVGGLGFLPVMQQHFSKFSFAGGVLLAGSAANEIVYRHTTLTEIVWVLATYVVLAVIILCLPLLVLAPYLFSLKRRGMLAYGALGSEYLTAFESKWLEPSARLHQPPDAARMKALDELGGEYGTLTDLNAAYLIAQRLPIIPINKDVLIGIALPAVLPMVPIAFLALGVQELLKRLAGLLG